MGHRLLTSTAALALLAHAGMASAQDRTQAQPNAATTPTVVVEDAAPPATGHAFGDPIDSGTSIVSREAVEAGASGSGDVNLILRDLPTAQFSQSRGIATRDNLQDLRPAEISISGGAVTDNLFLIDGVGVNSYIHDTDEALPGDFTGAGVAAGGAQTHWVDSSLVGELIVRDSNVSARYGDFMGGVVEINTRAPRPVFGFETFYGLTTDSMAEYRASAATLAALGTAVAPDEPKFEKERFGFSVDMPVNDRLRLLAAYNQTNSTVTNFPGNLYLSYGSFGLRSKGENYLLKGEYDLAPGLRLTGSVAYTPYESQARQTNTAYDNLIVSHGGGLVTQLGLDGSRGSADWSLKLSHSYTDNNREAPSGTFNISTSAPGLTGCSSGSSCTIGSAGDFLQEQNVTTLKGEWEQPLGFGRLSAGFDLSRVEAHRAREQELVSHLTTSISANTVCLSGESLACRTGSYALTTQLRYGAFDARANLDSVALWGEYRFDLGGFDVRAGLRYDYESFLENHNIAPRLSVAYELPWGMTVTGGLNRYYNRSFVGYALREGSGQTRTYTRTPTIVGTERRFSDTWTLTSHTDSTRYSGLGLDTPYSDEATLGLIGKLGWIGGEYRLRGVLRDSRDMISRSARTTEIYDRESGGTATRTVYTANNDGERSYRGLSFEYERPIGTNHTVNLSANVSKTKASNISYFEMADSLEFAGRQVYYQGQVVDLLEAIAENQVEDFASPFELNARWASRWFNGRLKTSVSGHYRDGFELVSDTGVNISVSGTSYDVYDKVKINDSVDVDLNAQLLAVRSPWGEAYLDVRVNNLFNAVSNADYVSTTQPWQLGRNAWVSIKFKY